MSLVQLESFVAVAEEAHVGRAARRLHLTQPPLTRRIHQLEEELGVQLFERTPRGMQLSSAGVALLPEARAILDRVAQARDLVRRVADPMPEHASPASAKASTRPSARARRRGSGSTGRSLVRS